VRGSKTRETSAIMEASGRESLRSVRIPPREMDPGALWIGHWAALRVKWFCMAKRKKI